MSFNPPPNWPVPPNWSPPPDWDPPPSWPQAPQGWTFWVDELEVGDQEAADTVRPEPTSDIATPGGRWRLLIIVVASIVMATLVVGIVFLVAGKPSTTIRTQPHTENLTPETVAPGWREPGWGSTPLYIDFSAWTKFGGIDADFSNNGESVLLDTHDTTDTWLTKWSGLISPLTTTCAARIVGRVRDVSHTAGSPGGFAVGLGTLSSGNPDNPALSGTAIQFDFGQQGFRTAIYPSDSDHGLAPAALDHQWHDIEVTVDTNSHTLIVDGQTVATTRAGGQCGHPLIRVWAGSAEFANFTVTPLD